MTTGRMVLCDTVQEFLLDADWDAGRRREVEDILRHAQTCDACRSALADFDALRLACASTQDPSEPKEGWDAMERRLAATVQRRQSTAQLRLRRWGLAVAAALLIAGAGVAADRIFVSRHPVVVYYQMPAPPEKAIVATLSPPVVSQAVDEFREISRIGYEGRAGWMLVSRAQSSSVGVVPKGLPLAKKVLFLRLALMRGKEVVSDSDLMVRAGQKADLTVPLPAGQSLRYRVGTSIDDPAHLTLWLDLNTPHGGEPLAALGTNLQVQPGRKLSAGKLTTSAGEYELNVEFASAELAED